MATYAKIFNPRNKKLSSLQSIVCLPPYRQPLTQHVLVGDAEPWLWRKILNRTPTVTHDTESDVS
jgi:hypothetical protein